MQGYCIEVPREAGDEDVQQVTLKNGREARQGTCAVCGTKVTVMGKGEESKA
ncbi:MAG: DUF5679 domain-containing protein [Thermomicrobiales bacterium]